MPYKLQNSTLSARRDLSEKRLAEFSARVADIDLLRRTPDLTVYVTGSYGRLEAHSRSDLDLFFIDASPDRESPVDRQTKTLIDAALIGIVNELGFPPFSNEGQYLEIIALTRFSSSSEVPPTTPRIFSQRGSCCFLKAGQFRTMRPTIE